MPAAIAEKMYFVDVEYQGMPRLIACGVLETDAGLLLVDPGPTVSMPTLVERLGAHGATLADVHGLLLTHIHLDHAGAAGSLVAAAPHLKVYVHGIGARHLVRPERLLASARRLYGDAMDRLWGDFLPVPEASVHALDGGEELEIGGRRLAVAYTPGHAIHHVSFLDAATGTAFVGDTAGMRVAGADVIVPVAPPPDVDVPAWHTSLGAIRAWQPSRLFVTHFGPADDPADHLGVMADKLDAWAEEVRRSLGDDRSDEARAAAFHDAHMAHLRDALPADLRAPYERFGQPLASWHGLARYWRKREQRGEQ